jgi:hypothetical protein
VIFSCVEDNSWSSCLFPKGNMSWWCDWSSWQRWAATGPCGVSVAAPIFFLCSVSALLH